LDGIPLPCSSHEAGAALIAAVAIPQHHARLSPEVTTKGVFAPGSTTMAKVVFTPNIQRHVLCPQVEAPGATVREVLENVFAQNCEARAYVLDDQSALRRHMTVFVDGTMIRDRVRLGDPVRGASTIYVFQALSGG
jgi:sulfur-carrier protein